MLILLSILCENLDLVSRDTFEVANVTRYTFMALFKFYGHLTPTPVRNQSRANFPHNGCEKIFEKQNETADNKLYRMANGDNDRRGVGLFSRKKEKRQRQSTFPEGGTTGDLRKQTPTPGQVKSCAYSAGD